MKRKINLEINIDSEGILGCSQIRPLAKDSFEIIIAPDLCGSNSQFDPCVTLMHELGHMVGIIFDFPGAFSDPRGMSNPAIVFPGAESWTRVIESEIEAWNIGEQIMKAMLEVRTNALKSYQAEIVPTPAPIYDWSYIDVEDVKASDQYPTPQPGLYRPGATDQADTGQAPEASKA